MPAAALSAPSPLSISSSPASSRSPGSAPVPLPAQTVAPVSSTLAGPPACSTASQVSPPSATPVATAVGLNALPREPAPAVEDEDEEVVQVGAAGTGAVVDMEVFGQLLEIDDDESHEFSKTLAFDYISQADTTFSEIEEALKALDLETLSRKGHFLKGSSAALGLQRVQHSCESMQHFGNRKDENGEGTLSEKDALRRCRKLLKRLRDEQEEAKEWLEGFYRA